MPEPAGLLAPTEMPQFSLLGLLLGGKGYASGWFSQRDHLRLLEAQEARERADRQAFAGGLLQTPEYKQMIASPQDRGAQFGVWGKMFGGPEQAVSVGNSLLVQGLGAIEAQELEAARSRNTLAEQTHSADEQLRVAKEAERMKLEQRTNAMKYLLQPDARTGMTGAESQMAANLAAETAGIPIKEGYDVVVGPNGGVLGQIPQRGTPERTKMESVGNSISNIQSTAQQSLWELQNGQVDKGEWEMRNAIAMNDFRILTEAGAMTEQDQAFYEKMLIPWSDTMKPELYSQAQDKLISLNKLMDQRLKQYTATTLLPIESFTADDWKVPKEYQPTAVPSQEQFNRQRTEREERLKELPSRNEKRIRPPIQYEKPTKEGTFSLPAKPRYTRGGTLVK